MSRDDDAEVASVPNQNTNRISVANDQVSQPENFSSRAEEWLRWIRRFERFRKATALDEKDEKIRSVH